MTEQAKLLAHVYDALPKDDKKMLYEVAKRLALASRPDEATMPARQAKRWQRIKTHFAAEGTQDDNIDWPSVWRGFCL